MVRRRKVALHTSQHLTPTEAWWSPDSTTWEGCRVSSEVRLENWVQVWGWAKFEERGTHGWGKIVLHTCSGLSRLVRTYAQYRDHVRSARNFLHCQALLFFSLTSYPVQFAYLNSPNRQLPNGAWVMELYWNINVDSSRSSCLKAFDRKSFEHGNFLVLHPALLKIAYFNSGNRQLSIAILPKELRQREIVDPSRGAP